MARKHTSLSDEFNAERTAAKGAEVLAGRGPALRPSDIPGVWLNELNIPCDVDGVALSFKQVKARDAARFEEVLGEAADTPAKFLKAISLDPRVPMLTRIDAAKAAAPYSDRKQPIAVDGGAGKDGAPVPLFDFSKLSSLSDSELALMRTLVTKAGAAV